MLSHECIRHHAESQNAAIAASIAATHFVSNKAQPAPINVFLPPTEALREGPPPAERDADSSSDSEDDKKKTDDVKPEEGKRYKKIEQFVRTD